MYQPYQLIAFAKFSADFVVLTAVVVTKYIGQNLALNRDGLRKNNRLLDESPTPVMTLHFGQNVHRKISK